MRNTSTTLLVSVLFICVVILIGHHGTTQSSTTLPISNADFNDDGVTDMKDYALFSDHYGSQRGDKNYSERFDLNGDGRIDLDDLALMTSGVGQSNTLASASLLTTATDASSVWVHEGPTHSGKTIFDVDSGTTRIGDFSFTHGSISVQGAQVIDLGSMDEPPTKYFRTVRNRDSTGVSKDTTPADKALITIGDNFDGRFKYYKFTLSVRKIVRFEIRQLDEDVDVYLQDAVGTILDSSVGYVGTQPKTETVQAKLIPGTYYYRVEQSVGTENQYNIRQWALDYTGDADTQGPSRSLTYALSGDDSDLISIVDNSSLSFKTAPTYTEGGDNTYNFTLIATDKSGPNTATKAVDITVQVLQATPTLAVEADLGDITNQSSYQYAKYTLENESDNTPGNHRFSFTLTERKTVEVELRQLDYRADLVLENSTGGEITMSARPWTENEWIDWVLDAGSYYFRVKGTQVGENAYMLAYRVKPNRDIDAPGIRYVHLKTSEDDGTYSVQENTEVAFAYFKGFQANTTSITGGADMSKFQTSYLDTRGAYYVSFVSVPDYENPADSDGDNLYVFEITATGKYVTYNTTRVCSVYVTDKEINAQFAQSKNSRAIDYSFETPAFSFSGVDFKYTAEGSTDTTTVSKDDSSLSGSVDGLNPNTAYHISLALDDEWIEFSQVNTIPSTLGITTDTLTVREKWARVGSVEAADTYSGNTTMSFAKGSGGDSRFFDVSSKGSVTVRMSDTTTGAVYTVYNNPRDGLYENADNSSLNSAAGDNNYILPITVTSGTGGSELQESGIIVITVTSLTPAQQPFTLVLSKTSINSITASWNTPSSLGSVTGYTLYIAAMSTDEDNRSNPPSYDPVSLGADVTSYVLSELIPGLMYSIEVVANNGADVAGRDTETLTLPPSTITLTGYDTDLSRSIAEGMPKGDPIMRVNANLTEGDTRPVIYSLMGEDRHFFHIDNEGTLTPKVILDYETPVDSDKDNVYEITLVAMAGDIGGSTFDRTPFEIHVTDVEESPPVVQIYKPESDRSMYGADIRSNVDIYWPAPPAEQGRVISAYDILQVKMDVDTQTQLTQADIDAKVDETGSTLTSMNVSDISALTSGDMSGYYQHSNTLPDDHWYAFFIRAVSTEENGPWSSPLWYKKDQPVKFVEEWTGMSYPVVLIHREGSIGAHDLPKYDVRSHNIFRDRVDKRRQLLPEGCKVEGDVVVDDVGNTVEFSLVGTDASSYAVSSKGYVRTLDGVSYGDQDADHIRVFDVIAKDKRSQDSVPIRVVVMGDTYAKPYRVNICEQAGGTRYLCGQLYGRDAYKSKDADKKYLNLRGKHFHIPDFSYAGYHRFERPLPTVDTVTRTVSNWYERDGTSPINVPWYDVTDYGAVPDDENSDQDAIQQAIHDAEYSGGGVIYFPAGEYLILTDSDKTDQLDPSNPLNHNAPGWLNEYNQLTVNSGRIIFKGDGSGKGGTVIRQVNNLRWEKRDNMASVPWAITFTPFNPPEDNTITTLKGEAYRDSRLIVVDNASSISPGQWIGVKLASPEATSDFLSPEGTKSDWTRIKDKVSLEERFIVEAVKGDSILLNAPLKMRYLKDSYGITIRKYRPLEEVAVEDISFEGSWFYPFIHHGSDIDDGGWSPLQFNMCANGWVRRVTFVNVNRGMQLSKSAFFTSVLTRAAGTVGHYYEKPTHIQHAWNGFGKDAAGSIAGNRGREGQYHGIGFASRACGNVFYKWDQHAGQNFNFHANQPYANLFDNIVGGRFYGPGNKAGFPNHLDRFVGWNMEYGSISDRDIDFWDVEDDRYLYILRPFLIGYRSTGSGSIDLEKVAISDYDNSDPYQVTYPQSLWQNQLELRLGYVPSWLNDWEAEWRTYKDMDMTNKVIALTDTIPDLEISLSNTRTGSLGYDDIHYNADSKNVTISTKSYYIISYLLSPGIEVLVGKNTASLSFAGHISVAENANSRMGLTIGKLSLEDSNADIVVHLWTENSTEGELPYVSIVTLTALQDEPGYDPYIMSQTFKVTLRE